MKRLNVAAATRARAAAVIVAAVLALLAAACGSAGSRSGGVASLGAAGTGSSSPTGSSSSSAAPGDAKLAFAHCMRAHGVTDFPDSTSKIGSSSNGGPGSDLDPYNPTFEAAYQACQSLLPPGQETLQQMHQHLAEQGLGFAKCMRAHGITGFPDPNAEGKFPEAQMHSLGKGSPQFTAAQDACQRYLNPSDGGGK